MVCLNFLPTDPLQISWMLLGFFCCLDFYCLLTIKKIKAVLFVFRACINIKFLSKPYECVFSFKTSICLKEFLNMIMQSTVFKVQNAWEYIQPKLFEYTNNRDNILITLQY